MINMIVQLKNSLKREKITQWQINLEGLLGTTPVSVQKYK